MWNTAIIWTTHTFLGMFECISFCLLLTTFLVCAGRIHWMKRIQKINNCNYLLKTSETIETKGCKADKKERKTHLHTEKITTNPWIWTFSQIHSHFIIELHTTAKSQNCIAASTSTTTRTTTCSSGIITTSNGCSAQVPNSSTPMFGV